MAHIDTGDAALSQALRDVRDVNSDIAWVIITFAPKNVNPMGNKLKVQATGYEWQDLEEEFDEGRAQFALYRVKVKEIWRFVYITWCGEGVQGQQKGNFGNYSVDMERWIGSFHIQINARCHKDLDLEKIIMPRLYKALGADYDAGGLEQSCAKDGRLDTTSYLSALERDKLYVAKDQSTQNTARGVDTSSYSKATERDQKAGYQDQSTANSARGVDTSSYQRAADRDAVAGFKDQSTANAAPGTSSG